MSEEYRYSGTTAGVRWVVTVGQVQGDEQPPPLRWETSDTRFADGALLIWPDFGMGPDTIHLPEAPAFLVEAATRLLTNALGVPASDGRTLVDASQVVEGPDGYFFRATDSDRMYEWLASGAKRALEEERDWLLSREASQHLLVVVLWRHGLQVATTYGTHDSGHIERVARLGAKLAEAARTDRFGRVL